MSFNNQGVVSIENQENCENRVISSQSSDNSSGSKRKPKFNQKNVMKTTDRQFYNTPSSTQSTISTQSDRTDNQKDATLVIHAIELDDALKYVLSNDFGVDTESEFILFEKQEEIKRLENKVAQLKQELNKK